MNAAANTPEKEEMKIPKRLQQSPENTGSGILIGIERRFLKGEQPNIGQLHRGLLMTTKKK
jgi:hypothetical protein